VNETAIRPGAGNGISVYGYAKLTISVKLSIDWINKFFFYFFVCI